MRARAAPQQHCELLKKKQSGWIHYAFAWNGIHFEHILNSFPNAAKQIVPHGDLGRTAGGHLVDTPTSI